MLRYLVKVPRVSREKQRVQELVATLAPLLGLEERALAVRASPSPHSVEVTGGGWTFAVEVLPLSSRGILAAHAERLGVSKRRKVISVLAVPYMSELGRRACEGAGLMWFDFCGNANIVGPGLRIMVDGRPNRFRRPGRPTSIFAPKSARVAR